MPDFDLDAALANEGYTVVQAVTDPPMFQVFGQGVPIGEVWWLTFPPSTGFTWSAKIMSGGGNPHHYITPIGVRRTKEECVELIKDYHIRYPEAFDA